MLTRTLCAWILAVGLCVLPMFVNASAQIEELLSQAETVRSSDPKRFQELLTELNSRHDEAAFNQREHIGYLNAYGQVVTGRYDEAMVNAHKLLEETSDIEMQVRTGALIVNLSAITRKFTDGLRQLEKTLALLNRVENVEIKEHVLGVAAVIHNQTGQYRLGRQYAERVLALASSKRARCFAGHVRLESMRHLGELPVEDAPFSELIALCIEQREPIATNLVRAVLARKWVEQGRRQEAIKLLRHHLPEVRATRYPRLISEVESLLAEYELSGGNHEAADLHAQAAIEQNTSIDYIQPLVSAHYTRYKVAELRKDTAAAFTHYRLYAEADKAYLDEVKTRELAFQIVRHETLQQAQQIELLDRENQVLQLQQRVDRQQAQSSRLLILLLIMLIGSIAYWAYKIKRVQLSLRHMAETDALTATCNRHHFSQQSEETLLRCARAGEDVALIMFDLDHFKSINDRFGHVTGDWVLRDISDACKHFCRRIDHLGRLGGEEFAILLSGCDLRGATRVAEDCRVRIASIDTQPSGHKFVVTASFGVTATALSGYDLTKLLSHADQMLYRAKREGRNRVCAYDGDTASEFKEHASTRQEELLLAPEGQLQSELPRIA